MEGEVLGGGHIAVLTGAEDGAGVAEVTVTLSVPRRGFEVTPLDEDGEPVLAAMDSEAKRAVLNVLIFEKLPRDDQGRAVVQKAKLRRRPKT